MFVLIIMKLEFMGYRDLCIVFGVGMLLFVDKELI